MLDGAGIETRVATETPEKKKKKMDRCDERPKERTDCPGLREVLRGDAEKLSPKGGRERRPEKTRKVAKK